LHDPRHQRAPDANGLISHARHPRRARAVAPEIAQSLRLVARHELRRPAFPRHEAALLACGVRSTLRGKSAAALRRSPRLGASFGARALPRNAAANWARRTWRPPRARVAFAPLGAIRTFRLCLLALLLSLLPASHQHPPPFELAVPSLYPPPRIAPGFGANRLLTNGYPFPGGRRAPGTK